MASQRHRKQRRITTAISAEPTPLSPSGRRLWKGALMTPGTKIRAPGLTGANAPVGAIIHRRSGATEFEGSDDGSVEAVAFLEGIESHMGAAGAEAAATEAPRNVIAPTLIASSGVVGTGNQGTEVVELTDLYRHARTAFPAMEPR
jgi:hypothetical protein